MKRKYLILFFTCFSIANIIAQNTVIVPAGQSVEIDYPDFTSYQIGLRSLGSSAVDVSVVSKKTGDQIRGFGLGKVGKEDVLVEQGNKLLLKNKNGKNVKIKYSISPYEREIVNYPDKYIKFTLQNTSDKSIPLIIPTVMNPNLSPQSKSGVSLKIGQEIFFKAKGKRQVLLVVDQSIQNGDVIDVANLLPKRKKELGIN